MTNVKNSMRNRMLVRLRSWSMAMALIMACQSMLQGQSQTPPSDVPGSKTTESTENNFDGLLDLLTEPDREAKEKGKTAKPPADKVQSETTLDGEDIGQEAIGPLLDAARFMSSAAERLRRNEPIDAVKADQAAVIDEIDRMLEQIKQSQAKQNRSRSASSSSATQTSKAQSDEQSSQRENSSQENANPKDSQTGRDPEAALAQAAKRDGDEDQSPDSDRTTQTRTPGREGGRNARVAVGGNDPKSMQQNAWGKLPQRRREQMQSRMVEQFLPAYRSDIEAYYRALSR